MPVGTFASAVHIAAAGTDVLMEPFNNLTAWSLVISPTIVAGGRTGNAMQISGADTFFEAAVYNIAAPAQADTIIVGFAFKRTDGLGNREIMRLASDTGSTHHNKLILTGGALAFTTGSSPLSSGGALSANTWYYIEVQAKLHNTAGFAVVKLNGTTVINVNPADTFEFGGTKTVYDQVRLCSILDGVTQLYDDLYITTGAGAPFKGSITIP